MRVQAEIFLLDNALMDGLVLLTAGAVAGLPLRRGAAGLAALGALYALLALAYGGWLLAWPARIGFGLVLALGLRAEGLREYARAAFSTLLAAFLLGGLALALGGGIEGGALIGRIPLRIAMIVAVCAALLPRGIRALSAGRMRRTVRLEIALDGETIRTRALVDTGNLLREPLSGIPVLILAGEPFETGLPVPYAGAGGSGLLHARRPASVRLLGPGPRRTLHVFAARLPGPLPPEVGAILPAAALQAGGEKEEHYENGLHPPA